MNTRDGVHDGAPNTGVTGKEGAWGNAPEQRERQSASADARFSAAKLALIGRGTWKEQGWLRNAEPIAIVGMACRFPGGVTDPESLWQVLLDARDVVTEVPRDRWDLDRWYNADPAAPGRIATRWGGFLDDIRGFDAAFFDISPREAERMDPQQRIALEVACEAFDDAGIALHRLRGSDTGVFFAAYHNDYTLKQYSDVDGIGARTLTGTLHSVLANRISYTLALHGPSLAVDSACSSSLVATHLACQALRTRDCNLAIAGGVNVMVTPHITVALSKGGFMSPTGRCRTFDASADGFVRSEGCAAVVLKRLADAIADGDNVLAVIRGSAVNQDGESTNLTAPNGLAQEALVRKALRNAGVNAEQVSLIEAHGTGTELGDPIETDALAAVFRGRDADRAPCYLGSLKANLGHCEAAAGVAGLIKTVLCLQHRAIPAQVHFTRLNPHIDLHNTPFRIATQTTPWNSTQPRIAGVSSFGVGGTNAHVIVEESTLRRAAVTDASSWPCVLPLSARSAESLRALADEWGAGAGAGAGAERLEGKRARHAVTSTGVTAADLRMMVRAAARRRTHHRDCRVGVVADSADALLEQLRRVATGTTTIAEPGAEPPRLGFVYSGQGTQWATMGLALMARERVFRACIERLDARWREIDGRSLIEELSRPAKTSQLDRTDVAQVGIFAIQVALTELLASWGIRPAAVIGHSVGELAAAVAAGALDADTALRAVSERGRVMQLTFDAGRMLAVRANEAQVQQHLAAHGLQLSIAAVNAPNAIVLSGATDQIEAARTLLQNAGFEAKLLDVRFGFHSELMRSAAQELRATLHGLHSDSFDVPLISTVTGHELEQLDAEYLARNIESPVRFSAAVERALERGISQFVELGPHPALGQAMLETAEARRSTALVAFALHRSRDAALTTHSLAERVYEWGVDPDWAAIDPGPCPPVRLPRYPWAHRPYWLPERQAKRVAEYALDDARFAALRDHRIDGRALLPATALLELLRSVAKDFGVPNAEVHQVALLRPTSLDDAGRLQIEFDAEQQRIEVFTVAGDARERVAEARVARGDAELRNAALPGDAALREVVAETPHTSDATITALALPANVREIKHEHFYAALQRAGCDFGPAFRLLSDIRTDTTAAHGNIAPVEDNWTGDVHPAVVDAAAQLCMAALGHARHAHGAFLPWAVDRYVVSGSTEHATSARVVLRDGTQDGATFDVDVLAADGSVLVHIQGWRVRRATTTAVLHTIDWVAQPIPPTAVSDARPWLILHDDAGLAENIAAAFDRAGCSAEIRDAVAHDALTATDGFAGVIVTAFGNVVQNDELPNVVERATTRLLRIAQRFEGITSRLLVVTRATRPVGAGVWGLARAIRAERPELRCTSLDLPAVISADEADAIVAEALAGDAAEVALRDGSRLVARLAPAELLPVEEPIAPCALVHESPGTLDGFVLWPLPEQAPAADQVAVDVLAAGVNFRDVLTALGEYPGEAAMGFEACGLLADGSGQRVLVFAPGCFATRVNVPRACVFPAPAGMDPAAAATIPVAFGTAWFALHRVGAIRPGMRVLVHSGAGGVGLATIQLALRAGAEVYATAGTPEKRALLERLGVAAAFDSRSTSFEECVGVVTGGAGVDIVVNSLTGPLIPAGLRCLREGGVFVELGKREILQPTQLQAIRDDVRYVAFDLREEEAADPTLLPGIFAELIPLFERGALQPLPFHFFPLADAASAFRRMARAEHVGKLVLVPERPADVRRDGWFVVTGGLGALGQATTRWLAARGARRIAVVGRSGGDPRGDPRGAGAGAGAGEVEGKVEGKVEGEGIEGGEVPAWVFRADVADAAALGRVLAELRREAPIVGVIHAAGVVDDGLLPDLTPERVAAVLAPKVRGAWNLHLATRDDPLELFVLYSAAGPVLNAAGLGSYAAANSFLDALATYRRSRGLPGTSVLWGPWAGDGMAGQLTEAQRARWDRFGLEWWTPDLAVRALDRIAAGLPEQVLALRLRAQEAPRTRWEQQPAPSQTALPRLPEAEPQSGALLVAMIRGLPEHRRLPAVVAHVRDAVGAILGREQPVDVDAPLRDLGLDSLGAIELRNTLAVAVGEPLPATLAFDHPTVSLISIHLLDKARAAVGVEVRPEVTPAVESHAAVPTPAPETPSAPAPQDSPAPKDPPHPDAVAIVGVGIRAPGGVDSLEAYARLLFDGVDAVGPVPPERLGLPDGEGGFLESVDRFDPEFFGIAPLEASTMDPQQRLLLETVWEALEHAAIAPTSLRGSRAGVFVGIGTTDYHRMVLADPAGIDTYASTGTAFSVASGRIAYVLGLNGPAISVDTACSSSLVAVHLAVQSLRRGESDVALAAGVNLILSPELTVNFRQAGMLSPANRCRTFDASADGYVRGEGCGVVVLKRVADALRDGDRILAVIRGSALNQDGRSSGLTAPSGPAQEAVIRAALADAGLQPDDIGYLEAHGTGTTLGDPIELQAIGAVFGGRERPLLVGSAKTNFGHLEAAAGIVGLIKAIVALLHREVPPHLHFEVPSPQIPWDRLPVAIPTRRTPFEPGRARRAGVSSFGFSGTNAHVIVEEAPAPAGVVTGARGLERPVHLLTLSAPDTDALRALAERYVRHLEHTDHAFADICHTANSGRAHFAHRLAIVADDSEPAAAALRGWLDAARQTSSAVLRAGVAMRERPAVAFLFPGAIDPLSALHHTSVAFRDALDACEAVFRTETGASLLAVLEEPGSADRAEHLIPARVVVQHALSQLWRSWGIEPDVIAGEPLGELPGGIAAGILSIHDALRLAAAAGRAHRDGVGLDAVVRNLSPALTLQAPTRQFLSAAAPNAGPRAATTTSFWSHVLTGHGRLLDLAPQLTAERVRWLVTIGTVPSRTDRDALLHGDGVLVGSRAGGTNVWETLLTALAELYVAGANPDWRGFERGWTRRKVTLPSYPFQRRRFWFTDATAPIGVAAGAGTELSAAAADTPAGAAVGAAATAPTGVAGAAGANAAGDSWTAAVAASRERALLAPIDLDIGSYRAKWQVLQHLAETLGRNTLIRLGAFAEPEFDLEQVLRNTGIEPLYCPIVRRWLDAMVGAGELDATATGWKVNGSAAYEEWPTSEQRLQPTDIAPLQAAVDAALADDPALLRYIHHSASRLEGVLTGRASPLDTLFPDGSFDLASALYESAGPLRYTNGIARESLRAWAAARQGAIRVLEVGAGTGGTTSSLVGALPADRTSYDFTDVSPAFLDYAREKFAHTPFLNTRLFDLEQDLAAQGIQPGSYDVVVGSNVLHAMRDLPAALRRVRELLAPDGLLLLIESTGHHAWHDITTGLIEGWQHFADGRSDSPLLAVDRWRDLLFEAGFSAVESAPGEGSRAGVLRQHVILASALRIGNGFESESDSERESVAAGAGNDFENESEIEIEIVTATATATGRETEDAAADAVRGCVMEVLRSDPARPPSRDARLMDLGIDSLMAVRLRNLIQSRLGVAARLPSTLVFDYPTIRHIARLVISLDADDAATAEAREGAAGRESDARRRGGHPTAGMTEAVTEAREREIARLSEAEAEALLLKRLDAEEAL